ncbi:MAG TPA: response regulator [Tabrizicola sp.]|nr:response regulator [Tabrizicola sp.]
MDRKPRILVVEDEDSIAVALDYLMTREGYDHDRVASGARIRDTHPDLVLLDVLLPEVSGYEICEGIRTDPSLSDVKVLMMTARACGGPRRRWRRWSVIPDDALPAPMQGAEGRGRAPCRRRGPSTWRRGLPPGCPHGAWRSRPKLPT